MDHKEYMRQWRKNNKDKHKEYMRQWRKNNKDKVRECNKKRYKKLDPLKKARIILKQRIRYKTDSVYRNKSIERNKKWRADNPEKARDSVRRHTEKIMKYRPDYYNTIRMRGYIGRRIKGLLKRRVKPNTIELQNNINYLKKYGGKVDKYLKIIEEHGFKLNVDNNIEVRNYLPNRYFVSGDELVKNKIVRYHHRVFLTDQQGWICSCGVDNCRHIEACKKIHMA